ncbi:putative transposase [Escherichia coli DEC7C]|nr:putative transposase [Escherichia coli DEC7C]
MWQPASYFSGASNTRGKSTAVAAGEQVVPASELAAAMKQIKELQRLLGQKNDGK